jgi:hypothetical protein
VGIVKQIAVLSFTDNADVYDGLSELIDKHPSAEVLLPVTSNNRFVKSALKAILEKDSSFQLFFSEDGAIEEVVKAEDITFCVDPNKEIMRHIAPNDVLALVWDESTEAHVALHALEDFGLETWNIADGLDVIEVEYSGDTTDDIREEMFDHMHAFVESLANYITSQVLDVLTEEIAERIREDETIKDIRPFEDDGL